MRTIVNFVLDQTGSMMSIRDATISGFNEYVETLKNDDKTEYEFSLVTFNSIETKKVYESENVTKIKKLDTELYQPNGMTPLYDAVCTRINEVKNSINDKTPTIFVIMTDGEENDSKEYTEVQMKALIQELEKKGNWTFVYLGANQDAYANAAKYGIKMGNTLNWDATERGTGKVFASMARSHAHFMTQAYEGGNLQADNFFEEEKDVHKNDRA